VAWLTRWLVKGQYPLCDLAGALLYLGKLSNAYYKNLALLTQTVQVAKNIIPSMTVQISSPARGAMTMNEEITVYWQDMETFLKPEEYRAFLKAKEEVDEYTRKRDEHEKKR